MNLRNIVLVAIGGLFAWFGVQMVKYTYSDSLTSAKDVPVWMVDGRYGTLTDADMRALRSGRCSHDPIFVRPKADNTAVLTCGLPARLDPVLLFVADSLDLKSINGQANTPNG